MPRSNDVRRKAYEKGGRGDARKEEDTRPREIPWGRSTRKVKSILYDGAG